MADLVPYYMISSKLNQASKGLFTPTFCHTSVCRHTCPLECGLAFTRKLQICIAGRWYSRCYDGGQTMVELFLPS
jgi:hypothetical protein